MKENKQGKNNQSIKITFGKNREDYSENLKHLINIKNKHVKNKEKKIQKNLEILYNKAKKLNESIPDELLKAVTDDIMVGASFFDKYEKWLK